MKFRGHCLPLFVVLLGISTRLLGQDTASLTGTITDVTGAIVTDAQVSVANLTNGVRRVTRTNAAGEYLVPGLPPAPYDVVITAPGFATAKSKT
jgi:hypothetical protein